jgi:anti-sigma B factor antagonist
MTDFTSQGSVVRDGLGLIELSGEVDLYTAPRFKDELIALVDDGVVNVVIDLSQVTFIDSTALGVIIGGVKRLHERDGRLALVASSRPVVRILDITGLDRVLTVFDTREAALAAF